MLHAPVQPPADPKPPAARRRRLLRIGVRLIGPALLLVVLLQLHDLDTVLAALTWDDAGLLAAGIGLGLLAYPLKALRWRTLLAARGHPYPPARALLSLLSAGYVGHLTPGRVGDLLRLQYLRHDLGMPYPDGLALLMIDRCCDVYVPLTVVVFAAIALAPVLTGDLLLVTWLGVLFMAAGPPLLFIPATARAAAALALRLAPGSTGAGTDRFFAGLRHQRPRHLAGAAGLVGAVAVEQIAVGVDRVADLVHGDRRRHLAGGVAAHAVGDEEQAQLLVDEEVVLVVGPLAPHVGGGREGQLHRRERRTGFPGRSNRPGG